MPRLAHLKKIEACKEKDKNEFVSFKEIFFEGWQNFLKGDTKIFLSFDDDLRKFAPKMTDSISPNDSIETKH